jgi:hypothetical protein
MSVTKNVDSVLVEKLKETNIDTLPLLEIPYEKYFVINVV